MFASRLWRVSVPVEEKALCLSVLSLSVFKGDLSTTEDEKRDSRSCSLFLQPVFCRSLFSQLLAGASGSSLVVFANRKTPQCCFMFRVLSGTGSSGRGWSHAEHCVNHSSS